MKYCPNCGSPCDNSDIICKFCGTMLEAGAPAQNNPAQPTPPAGNGNQPYPGPGEYGPGGNAPQPGAYGGPPGGGYQGNYGGYNNYSNTYNPQPPVYTGYNIGAKTNSMAIASMVLGIASIPFLMCYGLGAIPAIIAIVLGFVSRSSIKKSGGAESGGGMALAGIVLGIVSIAIVLLILIALAVLFATGVFSGGLSGSGLTSNPSINT
jgi:hypothetical protein